VGPVSHPDEVADAEGDAGRSYTDFSRIENDRVREILPRLLARWDGGPVKITGTISDGEQVAGFRVIHTPGMRLDRSRCCASRIAC
jgi:hydroxyacylglutathione hydrolase